MATDDGVHFSASIVSGEDLDHETQVVYRRSQIENTAELMRTLAKVKRQLRRKVGKDAVT